MYKSEVNRTLFNEILNYINLEIGALYLIESTFYIKN